MCLLPTMRLQTKYELLNDDAASEEYHEDVSDEYSEPLFIPGTPVVVFKHSEARRGNNESD